MENKLESLIPGASYHLYNRANGNESIFLSEENYRFFKMKFELYILPIADIYCYCLMPNHFHFLIRIKSEKEIELALGADKCGKYGHDKLVSKQFSNLFSSYTQAFNKVNSRMGSLFIKNFKRKRVKDDQYFRSLVYYIHHNPLKAGLSENLSGYKHSSYKSIVNDEIDFVLRKDVISFFDDLSNFIYFHKKELSGEFRETLEKFIG